MSTSRALRARRRYRTANDEFISVLARWLPQPARPLVRWIIPHMLDHDLREALMISTPTKAGRALGRGCFHAARGLMALSPKRTTAYPFRARPPFLYGASLLGEDPEPLERRVAARIPTLPPGLRAGRQQGTIANAERRP